MTASTTTTTAPAATITNTATAITTMSSTPTALPPPRLPRVVTSGAPLALGSGVYLAQHGQRHAHLLSHGRSRARQARTSLG
jgi:hypothetical protein